MGQYPQLFQTRSHKLTHRQCWVSVDFQPERLWLHYLWIFIVEFGTIAIYSHIFLHLRGRLRSIINNDTSKLSRATKFMVMYPAVYVILTLPIAVGRMVAMAGVKMPDVFFCIAGSLITSCGWIDALLYTLTRRVFVGGDISGHHYNRTGVTAINTNAARPGDDEIGMRSLNKEMGARTVTIVGGANRISRMVDSRSRSKVQRSKSYRPGPLGEDSRAGSQDSIMKPGANVIGIVTETNIQVETMHDSASERTHGGKDSREGRDDDYRGASPI